MGSRRSRSASNDFGSAGGKGARQGSTVGVVIVKDASELDSAMAEAGKYDRTLLIEKFVPGRELTIAVLGDQPCQFLK